MGRSVKVGDRLIVSDGNLYPVVVVALTLQSKAMYVKTDEGFDFWLPMTAFVDWDERPVEFPIVTFLKLTEGGAP